MQFAGFMVFLSLQVKETKLYLYYLQQMKQKTYKQLSVRQRKI